MKKTNRSVWFPQELWEQISAIAESERRTASNFILILIELGLESWLKKHSANGGAA
ncbi:MAG: ribbon-helix-helix domain-containing protein [Methylobacter sp.]